MSLQPRESALLDAVEHAQKIEDAVYGVRCQRGWGFGYWGRKQAPGNPTILRAADLVALAATEDDELYPGQLDGLPFDGATRARLRIVNQALYGYPVRYLTATREGDGRGYAEGVFAGITMPGDWTWTPWGSLYDLTFHTSWYLDGTACGRGSSHCLGLGALLDFEVLSKDPWDVCHECGLWRPLERLRPAYTDFIDEEDRSLNAHTLVCRKTSEEGYCR